MSAIEPETGTILVDTRSYCPFCGTPVLETEESCIECGADLIRRPLTAPKDSDLRLISTTTEDVLLLLESVKIKSIADLVNLSREEWTLALLCERLSLTKQELTDLIEAAGDIVKLQEISERVLDFGRGIVRASKKRMKASASTIRQFHRLIKKEVKLESALMRKQRLEFAPTKRSRPTFNWSKISKHIPVFPLLCASFAILVYLLWAAVVLNGFGLSYVESQRDVLAVCGVSGAVIGEGLKSRVTYRYGAGFREYDAVVVIWLAVVIPTLGEHFFADSIPDVFYNEILGLPIYPHDFIWLAVFLMATFCIYFFASRVQALRPCLFMAFFASSVALFCFTDVMNTHVRPFIELILWDALMEPVPLLQP